MITRGDIGRRIWIYQIIKRTTDSTDNNTYTELFRCYRMGVTNSLIHIICSSRQCSSCLLLFLLSVTKQLKADNQMLWVQRMNNIRNRATKIVNAELIYTWSAQPPSWIFPAWRFFLLTYATDDIIIMLLLVISEGWIRTILFLVCWY